MRNKIFIIAVLLLPFVASGQTKETFAFAERDSTLYLDVWHPAEPRSDSACVIALFGGGFVAGERDNEYQTLVAKMLCERGFVVVSPDYRLGLKDTVRLKKVKGLGGITDMFQWTIDIAAEDCAAACRWVVDHAAQIGVSTSRVVLTGSSAGAIAVLQMDYCRANALPEAAVLPGGWMPAAVVPYAGAIMSKGAPRYVTPPAPTMLMHGTKDKIVAYRKFPGIFRHALRGSKTVYKRMLKQDFPTWIIRFEGIGHEVASFLPGSVDLFCGFVEQVFNGRRTTLDATMHDAKLVPTEWTDMTVIDLYRH